jgi:hypothetical protein
MYMKEQRNSNGDIEVIQLVCPPLGLNAEAICEAGKLEFFSGYWHDGLVEMGGGFYEHPADKLLDEDSRFYACPVRVLSADVDLLPSFCFAYHTLFVCYIYIV